jgi:NADPH:quinone reductase-like Zn-dependent oxidoreductase
MVRSIGADRVVDYTQQDFTQTTERYDIFLDNVGNRSLSACRRLLNSNGTYIAAGGSTDPWMLRPLARMVTQLVLSRLGSQSLTGIFAKASQADLAIMCNLMKAGKVIPVLDKTYTFSELREAIRYLETGHARGKVVITFD